MKDEAKTKEQFIDEVAELRQRIAELETVETERKQAEEALQKSEESYRTLVEDALIGIMNVDITGKITYVNKIILQRTGYSQEELVGKNAFRLGLVSRKTVGALRKRMKEKLMGKPPGIMEIQFRRKDGEWIWLQIKGKALRKQGIPVGIQIIGEDITERKQAEAVVRLQSEITASLSEGIQLSRVSDGTIIYVNPRFEEMFGYDEGELIGKNVSVLNAPNERNPANLVEQVIKNLNEKGRWCGEVHNVKKDGTYFWTQVTVTTFQHAQYGEVWVAVQDDITERKQAEEALQQSEERYRALINLGGKVGEAVIMVEDTEEVVGLHTFASAEWSRITGYSTKELLGMSFFDLVHPKDRAACLGRHHRRRQGENVPGLYEITIVRKDGTEVPIEITAAVTTYKGKPANVGYIRDITERKQAEEREKQLQQELYLSSRLASIGELAAGVAHEINNPLTGMIGFSQRLLRKSTDEATSRDLERIHHEAQRAARVVQNLLTFARRHEPIKECSDINDFLGTALELRAYELRTSNIELAVELAPGLPKVMADFQQMQDVFLNIILNAEQAMTEAKGGGKLTIKTQKMKDHVKVCFTDDGPGIPAEHLDRLFDPFFTTRGERGGTGLGLSVCHGIVKEHGGKIHAKSKPGKGAIFSVELPLIDDDSDRVDGSGGFGITSLRNAFQP